MAVTGATGRLGRRVAERLAAAGVPQRLLARDPSRLPALPLATAARSSYTDAPLEALRGIRTLLMVSASETPDRVDLHRAFIDRAQAAGVQHVVYTSFYGASPTATFTLARDHWATEEHLRAGGMRHTFLRDNLYADFVPTLVSSDGMIRGPGGDGRAAVVAQDDIADVAAAVLRDPAAHSGATYDLTGPQALTLQEIAGILTRVRGRPVTYVRETLDEAWASRAAYGAPDWQVQAWVSTYAAIAAGELAGVSTAVREVTGHAPASLEQVLSR